MDPVSLSVAAAALVVQAIKAFAGSAGGSAAERAGERIGDAGVGILRRLVDRIRSRFDERHDLEGSLAIEKLEKNPDSAGWREDLQEAITRQLLDAHFAADVAALLEEASSAGLTPGRDVVAQHAVGSGITQVGKTTNSTVSINTPPPAG